MEDDLKSSIDNLAEIMRDSHRNTPGYQRPFDGSGRFRKEKTKSINMQSPWQEQHRPSHFSGGDLNPRVATPMGPGGFRVFLGGASGIRLLKKILVDAQIMGVRHSVGKMLSDTTNFSEAVGSPEELEKRIEFLTRARLGNLTEAEREDKSPKGELLRKEAEYLQNTFERTIPDKFKIDQITPNAQDELDKITVAMEKVTNLKDNTSSKISELQKRIAEQESKITTLKKEESAGQRNPYLSDEQDIQKNLTDELADAIKIRNRQEKLQNRLMKRADPLKDAAKDAEGREELAEQLSEEQTKREASSRIFGLLSKRVSAVLAATGLLITAFLGFRSVLLSTQQKLGGVGVRDAIRFGRDALLQSIKSIAAFGQTFVTIGEQMEARAAAQQEFGMGLSADQSAQLAGAAVRRGIDVGQYVELQRVFQGLNLNVSEAFDQFNDVDIDSQLAADELQKVPSAIARAGSSFNQFIVQGIKNAKRLGLEFSGIEKTLTGFSTDFEGTVTSFSELRAVIPGFDVDFNQLFSTALYGTTDDFIDQIRSSLMGAGISSLEGMSRTAVAALEQATGFDGGELERILSGQEVDFDEAIDLDTTRNKTLAELLAAVQARTATAGDIKKGLALIVTAIAMLAVVGKVAQIGVRGIAEIAKLRRMKGGTLEEKIERAGRVRQIRRIRRKRQGGGAVLGMPGKLANTAAGRRRTAAGAGRSVLGMPGRLAGSAGRVAGLGGTFAKGILGKVALPLTLALTAFDAFKGFRADPTAGLGGSLMNAGSSALSGLTFGLLGSSASEIAARSPGGPSYASQETRQDQPVDRTTMDRQVSNDIKALGAKVDALKTVWERGITAEMRGIDKVILSIQDSEGRGINA